jgi:putative exporter of polyketide antibiotics
MRWGYVHSRGRNLMALATDLTYAVLFSLLFGAIAGAISLTAGVLTRRLLTLLGSRGRIPATGEAIGVLVVGVALSATVGLIPPFFPFIWVPVLASVLGATLLHLRSLVDDTNTTKELTS